MQPIKIVLISVAALGTALVTTACGNSQSSASASSGVDTSASGAAAGAAGGALSGSNSNGTLAFLAAPSPQSSFARRASRWTDLLPSAQAESACPTFKSSSSAGCDVSGSSMWLTYDSCSFGGAGDWTGVQALTMSSGSASCGTFPNPGDSQTLYRQFVTASASTIASSATVNAGGYTATIDDATANLANFDGDAISEIQANGGYGSAVAFGASGARTGLTIGHHISVPGVFDHSVSGSLTVTETAGASSRVITGSVKVYHNLLKIVGTSTFNSVGHEDTCCFPISGSITTAFSRGTSVNPTAAGLLAIGKSETLTFTGCGTATLQGYDGSTASVVLDRCF